MKKIGKFIPVLVCSFLVAGGGLAALQGMNKSMQQAKAIDSLALTLGNTHNGTAFYATAEINDLASDPANWTARYYPTSADCIKVNGVNKATRFYPGDISNNEALVKISDTSYFMDLGVVASTGAGIQTGDVVTLSGTWANRCNDVDYEFEITTFSTMWNGTKWVEWALDDELEVYDSITLRDCGIFAGGNDNGKVVNSEDISQDRKELNHFVPSQGNTHNNFRFSFYFETFDIAVGDPNDASTITSLDGAVRVGNYYYDTNDAHYFQLKPFTEWGGTAGGVLTVSEYVGSDRIWHSGDVLWNLRNTITLIEFGNNYFKNGTKQLTYLMCNGNVVYSKIHDVTSTVAISDRVGVVSVRNTRFYNSPAEDYTVGGQKPTAGETMTWDTRGLFFDLPANDAYVDPNDGWSTHRYFSDDEENVLLNGAPLHKYTEDPINKYTANHYYLKLDGFGYDALISEGDVVTIQGTFRLWQDGVMYSFRVATTSWIRTATGWAFYEINDLQDSAADELEEGNLLANIGRTRPDNHASSVKMFDQEVKWDSTNNCEIDTLVYKKDSNGHTGIYFTSSDENTHGEFRVYFPDNGYKTETKAYAMTKFTFDYMIADQGKTTTTNRNHSLTEDGYYVPCVEGVNNTSDCKFTIQALVKYAKDSNMYHDFDVELVNDGCLHTVTLNLAYSEVMGFAFVLWNFDGAFFMSNVHADFIEYNANLESFVGNKLKMYSYVGDGQCASYYADAKTAYAALSADEKALFNTHAGYGSAKARLAAWALANGETFDATAGTFTPNGAGSILNLKNNSNIAIIVVASTVLAAASLLGVLLVLKKRKYSK